MCALPNLSGLGFQLRLPRRSADHTDALVKFRNLKNYEGEGRIPGVPVHVPRPKWYRREGARGKNFPSDPILYDNFEERDKLIVLENGRVYKAESLKDWVQASGKRADPQRYFLTDEELRELGLEPSRYLTQEEEEAREEQERRDVEDANADIAAMENPPPDPQEFEWQLDSECCARFIDNTQIDFRSVWRLTQSNGREVRQVMFETVVPSFQIGFEIPGEDQTSIELSDFTTQERGPWGSIRISADASPVVVWRQHYNFLAKCLQAAKRFIQHRYPQVEVANYTKFAELGRVRVREDGRAEVSRVGVGEDGRAAVGGAVVVSADEAVLSALAMMRCYSDLGFRFEPVTYESRLEEAREKFRKEQSLPTAVEVFEGDIMQLVLQDGDLALDRIVWNQNC